MPVGYGTVLVRRAHSVVWYEDCHGVLAVGRHIPFHVCPQQRAGFRLDWVGCLLGDSSREVDVLRC